MTNLQHYRAANDAAAQRRAEHIGALLHRLAHAVRVAFLRLAVRRRSIRTLAAA